MLHSLHACPLSNPCIGYPLVRTGLVEPTVSKVVENQKEKVLAVPESIHPYTLHGGAEVKMLVWPEIFKKKSLNFQPNLQHRNLFTARSEYCIKE